jgi:hypothetical protein
MDFEVPDKIKAITEMIDEFVDRELIPMGGIPQQKFREMLPSSRKSGNMVRRWSYGRRTIPRSTAAWD